jgi:hypothetical protein
MEDPNNSLYTSLHVTMTGPEPAVRLYAALMGVMAPEIQHSVALVRYEKEGTDREYRFTFDSGEAAERFTRDSEAVGIKGWSYTPENNTIILLDVKDWGGIDLTPVIKKYGRPIIDTEQRTATVKFIVEGDYGRVLQESRDSLPRDDGGTSGGDLDNLLRAAEERLATEVPD